MKRREVLRNTVLATGAAIAAPLYGALLSGCSSNPSMETAYEPIAFGPEQYSLLESVADTLLPATDTPSATQAGVVQTIDRMVGEVYSENDRRIYLEQFDHLAELLENEGFMDADDSRRIELLQQLETSEGVLRDAWMHGKQQIIALYLTSEEVAENFLNYDPVPGSYEACIPLSETNGKAWAI